MQEELINWVSVHLLRCDSNVQPQIQKTSAILAYAHVHILYDS